MKVLIFFLSFFSIFCFVLSAPTQSADCTNDDEICQNYFETQILPILIRVFICVFIFFVIFIFSIIIFCFLCHTLDPDNQYMLSVCIGLLTCYCYQFFPKTQQQQQHSKRKKYKQPNISTQSSQGEYFRLPTVPYVTNYKQPVSSVIVSV